MKAQKDKIQEPQTPITPKVTSEPSNGGTAQLKDNRTSTIDQRKLQDTMHASTGNETSPIQMKVNNTGLPDNLKSGIENLSGYNMDDVKVHYNSSKPAQLQAHAYAQGTDIHIAPGQQKHLPHEAWHVVQQKQGRVKPTRQLKSKVNINDDTGLEKEADVMGSKALRNRGFKKNDNETITHSTQLKEKSNQVSVSQREVKKVKIKLFESESEVDFEWNDADVLSRGADGFVYKATLNGKDVIVKTGRGIFNEIEIFKSLYPSFDGNADPAIIKPIGYNEDKNVLVLERAEGSLNNSLPDNLMARFLMVKHMWNGLQILHQKGIVYADMTQKNILFKGGHAKLADFGNSNDLVMGPLPAAGFEPTDDYKDFIKTSCNVLLRNTGTEAESIMTPDRRVILLGLLNTQNLSQNILTSIDNIVKKDQPTKQDCENFIENLQSCVSLRRKNFMKLLNR